MTDRMSNEKRFDTDDSPKISVLTETESYIIKCDAYVTDSSDKIIIKDSTTGNNVFNFI